MLRHSFFFCIFCLSIGIILIASPSNIPAQVAVEYGTIASKPSVKFPDVTRSSERVIQKDSTKRQGTRKEKAARPKNVKTTKGSGPLVIEQRGAKYERVN